MSETAGQGGLVPRKWLLLRAVEEAREPLGLKATSINVLGAMISFMKCDQISADRDENHICFASNATIARRAHVSVQTVERHVSLLVRMGLLRRVMSANGKRWARKDRQGRVVMATGLSLMPLSERHAEFLKEAEAYADKLLHLTMLRDKVSASLARLKSLLTSEDTLSGLIAHARNVLRRKPDENALKELLENISVEISRICPSESGILTVSDTEIEGHKEDSLNPEVKKENSSRIPVSAEQMERAFPRLCAELRFARDQAQCDRLMDDIADGLRLGETWYAMKRTHNPAICFILLGYIYQRAEKIQSHKAYLISLATRLDSGEVTHTDLIWKRPK